LSSSWGRNYGAGGLWGAAAVMAGVLAAGVGETQAAVLGTYAFTGADPAGDGSVPTLTHLTFGSLSRTNITAESVNDQFVSSAYTSGTAAADQISDYAQFTVTATAGWRVNLENLTFKYTRQDMNANRQGPLNGQVRSSFESYAAGSGTGSTFAPTTTQQTATWNFTDYSTTQVDPGATFRIYGWNSPGNPSSNMRMLLDDITLNGSVTALARMNVTHNAPSRVMAGVNNNFTVNVTNTDVRSAGESQDALTYAIGSAGDVSGSGSSGGLAVGTTQGSTYTINTTSGLKTGTITIGANNAFSPPSNVNFNYTAVNNRVVTASNVGLGMALVNTNLTGNSSLSTSGDNNNFTAVTVATTGGPDGNGASVTGGSGTLFDGASDVGSRVLDATFTLAGAYSGNVTLLTTGEGLSGEAPINVLVPYTATALDHSNGSFDTPADQDTLSVNFGVVPLLSAQSAGFSIYNLLATAGFTAALDLDAINESGDTFNKFSHNVAATQIAAGGGNGYSIFFDTSEQGVFSASYTIDLSDQDLPGATSQSMTINVSGEVVPEPTAALALLSGGLLATLRPRRRGR
jgi:hypothetical protein